MVLLGEAERHLGSVQVDLKGLNVKAKESEEDLLEKVVDNAEEVIIESYVFKVNQMLFVIMTVCFITILITKFTGNILDVGTNLHTSVLGSVPPSSHL